MSINKHHTFQDYIYSTYSIKNSGTASSYLKAIQILDELFQKKDIFNLNGKSLSEIKDPYLIERIIDYIAEEEDKYRHGENSIFDLGKSTQTSYPRKRFCTAAIRRLGEFVNLICCEDATDIMRSSTQKGSKLSSDLLKRFHINDKGTDKEIRAKRRVGQNIFRAMLLEIYDAKCCITGIDIPEVLRASHIVPWAECIDTRLNPENGLCLSATYDAAFGKHLITFDEDYRLVLSPVLKEEYTSEAFKTHFLKYEGTTIILPSMFKPSQNYLSKHRAKLIV